MPIQENTIVPVTPEEALAELKKATRNCDNAAKAWIRKGTYTDSDRLRQKARLQFAADVLADAIARRSPLVGAREVEVQP
jgi:hypothetical protein